VGQQRLAAPVLADEGEEAITYLDGLETLGTSAPRHVWPFRGPAFKQCRQRYLFRPGPRPARLYRHQLQLGERPATAGGVDTRMTASIGFWHNKHGQALIASQMPQLNPSASTRDRPRVRPYPRGGDKKSVPIVPRATRWGGGIIRTSSSPAATRQDPPNHFRLLLRRQRKRHNHPKRFSKIAAVFRAPFWRCAGRQIPPYVSLFCDFQVALNPLIWQWLTCRLHVILVSFRKPLSPSVWPRLFLPFMSGRFPYPPDPRLSPVNRLHALDHRPPRAHNPGIHV
jgi:hypothetical protein